MIGHGKLGNIGAREAIFQQLMHRIINGTETIGEQHNDCERNRHNCQYYDQGGAYDVFISFCINSLMARTIYKQPTF